MSKTRRLSNIEIIEKISRDPDYKGLVNHITKGSHYADDLFQEVILILLQYKAETIVRLWEANELTYFITRIVKTQFYSAKSPFKYKYGMNDKAPQNPDEYDPEIDRVFDLIKGYFKDQIKQGNWYEVKLLEEYIEKGSYMKLSKATGIPKASIQSTCTKFKEKIIDYVKNSASTTHE